MIDEVVYRTQAARESFLLKHILIKVDSVRKFYGVFTQN